MTSNICVLDLSGRIVAVNRAWIRFSEDNAGAGESAYVGLNYLKVCQNSTGPGSREVSKLSRGMQDVLEGRKDLFQIDYPCHSPSDLRWFAARVTPLRERDATGPKRILGAVVSHMDITDRKLLELKYSKLASTDPLTQLPNRRFFEHNASVELDRLRRHGGEMSLLMLDIDEFKSINDTHGHLTGDVVIKSVAARCIAAVRGSDFFARFGGDEFVALLPGTPVAGAVVLAEKLRCRIEALKIKADLETISVTGSIGVASVNPRDKSIKGALNRADQALYAAKSAGRNRVLACP